MKVAVVCYEDPTGWILGKISRRMVETLHGMGIDAALLRSPDPGFDVNHHVIYTDYLPSGGTTIDTLMITHVDTIGKIQQLRAALQGTAKLGVCMSRHTMDLLVLAGVPKEKLVYINPAHDGVMTPHRVIIGLSNKVHADGRSREHFLMKLSEKLPLDMFEFRIVGPGWEPVVDKLRAAGAKVIHRIDFDLDYYKRMLPDLDYFLYLGMDEGSMTYIDVMAAGTKSIVTHQGYHLDTNPLPTHTFVDFDELLVIFKEIDGEVRARISSVRSWTWKAHLEQHLELWQGLVAGDVDVVKRRNDRMVAGAAILDRPFPLMSRLGYLKFLIRGSWLRVTRMLRDRRKLVRLRKRILGR